MNDYVAFVSSCAIGYENRTLFLSASSVQEAWDKVEQDLRNEGVYDCYMVGTVETVEYVYGDMQELLTSLELEVADCPF